MCYWRYCVNAQDSGSAGIVGIVPKKMRPTQGIELTTNKTTVSFPNLSKVGIVPIFVLRGAKVG